MWALTGQLDGVRQPAGPELVERRADELTDPSLSDVSMCG
jgi:hypothetical protein